MKSAKSKVISLLEKADIIVNGTRPWDIKVHNDKLYSRILSHGSLGVGESYMDGWWDCDQLDVLFEKLLLARLPSQAHWSTFIIPVLKAKLMNLQSISRAFQVGEKHYDIGNDLYEKMLDKRMIYSCAYWEKAKTLDEAQEAKLDLICKKLKLKPGMEILEIGCGWGGFAQYAAKHYKVKVVGLTISKEQAKFARDFCKGLPVEILLHDYREPMTKKFDRVVSIGMFEHVGLKNYKTYFKSAAQHLKDEGLFLLHTIGVSKSYPACDAWIDKYIFRNGFLPSPKHLSQSFEGEFHLEDWHNFGQYYDTTLMAWYKNFEKVWPKLKGKKYDERFYRMWRYYLLSCAGNFRSKTCSLWQLVLTKEGTNTMYESIR